MQQERTHDQYISRACGTNDFRLSFPGLGDLITAQAPGAM
jgi:hypothetical protein